MSDARPPFRCVCFCALLFASGEQQGHYAPPPDTAPPRLPVEGAEAESAEKMRPYVERLIVDRATGATVGLEMMPIPAGDFLMGSAESELGRDANEGPQTRVSVDAFWMGRTEVTWRLYRVFMLDLDRDREPSPQDAWADAVSRPTVPYRPMDFGMGYGDRPAISMTQLAARQFTKWLTMKTGRFYRLPTEAEWELACRAHTTSAYSFGNDPAELGAAGWFEGNSSGSSQEVAQLDPNAWGLHDMHGNVSEWVLDELAPYSGDHQRNPIDWPREEYSRVVRGGGWEDEREDLRCAARQGSSAAWKRADPQLPQSIWYLTHARSIGLRVVRPLGEPSRDDWSRYWEPDIAPVRRIYETQRRGER